MKRDPGAVLRLLAATFLAALATLPIADWIPGGTGAPGYRETITDLANGTFIALGGGVVLALISRHVQGLWRDGLWRAGSARWDLTRPSRTLGLALAAAALYAVVARTVFSARPLLIDEIIQVWQARLFASGHLALLSSGHPELDGVMHIVDHAGKVFGQFPAGGPAMLALGSLVHAEWLVGPVFAALGLVWWSATLRHTEEPPSIAAGALLLLAFAPFAVFMSASHMNHVTSLSWIIAGMAGLTAVTATDRPRPFIALLMGLAFGLAGSIRPVDALAFGAPAGLWLFGRALRDRRHLIPCALAAIGMAVPLAATLWVNSQTTGHPFLFGYTLLWGPGHELGFHASPWGPPHTPARGLELINLYLLGLQSFFLETPFPALIPALGFLAFGSKLKPFDRYLAVSGGVLLLLYWAYWHNGFFLGPRFLYPLLPVLALWTARFGSTLRERWGTGEIPIRIWTYAGIIGLLLAVGVNVRIRTRQYSNAFLSVRWPSSEAAEAAGAHDALVLVRESWGAQNIARMWGLGVSRSEADFIYRRVDMCVMELALGQLEATGVRDTAATRALLALTADSSLVVDSVLSTDHTESVLPGSTYGPLCSERVRDDRRGFTLYPPLLLEDQHRNVYVRDLHVRDTVALKRYPGRPIFLVVPDDTTLGAIPRYHPVRVDSLLAAWGLGPPEARRR